MYLRLSPYREVLQGVVTSLQVNEGIIKITGKSGAGKTALCSQLFHELENAGQPAVFFLKPPASATALQNDILDNLALDPTGNFTRTLTAYLLEKTTAQTPLVLIFDDAQQLDAQTFGAIRMLCNIQDRSRAMVRVILCGTEELDERLAGPTLRAVTQFLNQSFTLPYLTQDQVNDFCHGYWMLMNEDMKPMGEKTLQKLHQETRGHPGILQARLYQGTTGAERSDRHDNANDADVAVAKPYRYAGPRKGWVPALLTITGLLVLGGAGVYLYVIPSFFADNAYPVSPPAARQVPAAPAEVPAAATVSEPVQQAAPEVAVIEAETAAEPEVVDETEIVVAPEVEAEIEVAVETEVAVAPELAEEAHVAAVAQAPEALEAVEATTPSEAELPPVEAFIAAWTASWQAQDVDAYLAHYHPDFMPAQGQAQDAWREQRRRVIGNAVDIKVSADAPEDLDTSETRAVVRFWLNYSTASYADRTLKELLLAPVDGEWRILSETSLRTERL